MPARQRLDATSQSRLAGLAAELGTLRSQPAAIPRRLLQGLLDVVPAQGPCSVIQFDRFVTEGGRFAAPFHNQPPPPNLTAAWDHLTRMAAAKMEHRLFARKGKPAVGTARVSDLFAPNEWPTSPLSSLAKKAGLGDMAYLWIRCSDEDLWVVCIRRRSFEPPFTDRDFSVLEEFGLWFGGVRQSWYVEDLHVLTDQELKGARLLASGKSGHEAAQALGMEKAAFDKHVDGSRKKLGATSRFELLNTLLNR